MYACKSGLSGSPCRHPRGAWLWLGVLCVALAGVARADVRIAPDSLDGLSAEALAGVEIVPAERGGGIRCTGRGIRVPTAENLTARSGTVDVTCAVGPEWPARGEHTLFHAQEGAQSRVTLSARGGTLTALYQAGEGQTASVRDRRSRLWAPGSRHRPDAVRGWGTDRRRGGTGDDGLADHVLRGCSAQHISMGRRHP